MNPTEGTSLGTRYTLTTRIAVGGMGEVWAATDTVLDRTVAVKLLNPGLSQESDFVERFRAEARHTAALQHPNIATVFDYGEDDGTAYLVMELVPGQPLSQIIADRAPLSAQETVAILIQAATALAAAHEGGVVHRDVKPANIMVTPDGTAKLTDFGISRAVDSVPLTQTGQVLGTAQYLSPEQALGQSATAASDIYALGVVGYEMLTGERPFDTGSVVSTALAHVNQPPPPLPETVPQGLADVISAAMAKAPADRPANAAEMAHALGMPSAAFASTAPVLPVPASISPATSGPSPTQVMPPRTRVMPTPTRTMPGPAARKRRGPLAPLGLAGSLAWLRRPQPPGANGRRPVWRLGAAAAVLGVTAFVALSQASGNDATKTPTTPATATISQASTPSTSATTPPVTPSVTRHAAPVRGQDNGKKKGKQ
jgi:eukaryotic-like serine/threonine-protein kinase